MIAQILAELPGLFGGINAPGLQKRKFDAGRWLEDAATFESEPANGIPHCVMTSGEMAENNCFIVSANIKIPKIAD